MTEFPKTDLARFLALPEAERALAVLSALRFVAKDDLEGASVSAETLEKIVDLGYAFRFSLQRQLTSATKTDVHALRRKGAVALARGLDVNPDSVPSETNSSCRRSAMFLDHSLSRSRFAITIASALATGHPAAVDGWEQDPERLADAVFLPGNDGPERQPLVADGLAIIRGPRGPEGLLVEVDRATERPGYLGRKYKGYLEWWRSGGAEKKFGLRAIRLVTIAPDDKRLTKLVAACREATALRAKGLYWFATEKDLAEEGILGPIWHTMTADRVRLWS